jgi:hypothetical protein
MGTGDILTVAPHILNLSTRLKRVVSFKAATAHHPPPTPTPGNEGSTPTGEEAG